MTTNADIQTKIAEHIADFLRQEKLLPKGYQFEVRLYGPERKKRSTAEFNGNWNPGVDSIRIEFSPAREEAVAERVLPSSKQSQALVGEERLLDVLHALDRAEKRPGYEFVSLKWFRDTALVRENFSWASDPFAYHDVLREAIDRRWILTSKVPNPRSPNFPVTAIRLNRLNPEVDAALGRVGGGVPSFQPVKIRGEALSSTIQRDRR